MPRLMPQSDEDVINIPGPGTFTFSAKKISNLGATEYTLVTIVVDISGSVLNFAASLLNCVKAIVESCKASDRAENLLIRFLTFNDDITEVHGFRDLGSINPDDYEDLFPSGFTALFDATYDGIGAILEYSKRLTKEDYDINGAIYIVTDGMNNRGMTTPKMIKDKLEKAIGNEEIESLVSILIGLHDSSTSWEAEVQRALSQFQVEAGLTEFIDIGDATPEKLAKLAGYVSESISSQSNVLGSGAPSQVLQF
jgi:hypothetical protein